jgi:hypothetical protein
MCDEVIIISCTSPKHSQCFVPDRTWGVEKMYVRLLLRLWLSHRFQVDVLSKTKVVDLLNSSQSFLTKHITGICTLQKAGFD